MRRYWLLFAQAVTIALGVLFVVTLIRPDLLRWREAKPADQLTIQQVNGTVPAGRTSSFADAANRAMPAVVNIFTQKQVRGTRNPFIDDPVFRHFFGDRFDPRPREVSSLGSGVVASSNGYILTSHHVIDGAEEIQVSLADGRVLPAQVVGADPETDLAVLKVNADRLPAITFGQSDTLRVGDWVLAIGNPFSVGQTVTLGIVSGLGRTHLGINTFENFIQTDAAINPGNSGGALVDGAGNLVGINSAIYTRTGGFQGIGFAVPVSLARQVMEQIIREGGVTRGWVGIEVQDLSPELAESFDLAATDGALIAAVQTGGPADRAGIKPGDVLLKVNQSRVTDTTSLLNLIAALKPGEQATLSVSRKNQLMEFSVKVEKRPPQMAQRDE